MSNTTKVQISFPFMSILCLIFITLKLTGYIAWSWLWILSPLWLPWAIVLGIGVLWFSIMSVYRIVTGK